MNIKRMEKSKTAAIVNRKKAVVKGEFSSELKIASDKSALTGTNRINGLKGDRLELDGDIYKGASEMSDREYEAHIYRTIDKMSKNNGSRQDNWVIISEKGLAAMKNDPNYEKWVLNEIKSRITDFTPFAGRDVKVRYDVIIKENPEECIFERHISGDGIDDGFSGPTKEEYRKIVEAREKENAKHRKYSKLLRENAMEKADMELEHIRGIYEDFLHTRKSICAVLGDMDYFWTAKGK